MKSITFILLGSLVTAPVLASEEQVVANTISTLTVAAPQIEEVVTVRVPEGEVEIFWSEQDWADLNSAEQALWGVLGWTEASWMEEEPAPASETKKWAELTEEELIAAQKLGYTQDSWDATLVE